MLALDVGSVVLFSDRLLAQPHDHRRLREQQLALLGTVAVSSMIFVSASSWRIITAGIPVPAWRIFSNARSTSRVVADIGRDHADKAMTVPVDPHRPPAGRHAAQALAQPVDAGERGERVVDRRRQRPDRDLDQLVDRERQILDQRPVGARDMRAAQRARDRPRRVRRPHGRDRMAGDDEVPGPVQQPDHRAALGGEAYQQAWRTNCR